MNDKSRPFWEHVRQQQKKKLLNLRIVILADRARWYISTTVAPIVRKKRPIVDGRATFWASAPAAMLQFQLRSPEKLLRSSLNQLRGNRPPSRQLKIRCSGSAVPFVRGPLNLKLIYFPSIPFFTCAVGGFGPNHTEKITCPNAGPAMVSLSWPLMAKVVPVPGT